LSDKTKMRNNLRYGGDILRIWPILPRGNGPLPPHPREPGTRYETRERTPSLRRWENHLHNVSQSTHKHHRYRRRGTSASLRGRCVLYRTLQPLPQTLTPTCRTTARAGIRLSPTLSRT
jgi:hypothetical protein